MKVIRNLFKTVTCDHRSRRFFGDEILHAEPVPKLLLMPITWRGDLQPVLDAYLAQLAPLTNGLTLGNVLHAEEIPHVLNLGTAWLGDFRDKMLASRTDRPGALDATPVLAALEAARRTMGTGGDPVAVADGLRSLRRAADRVSRRDEEPHGAFSEGRRIADATARRTRDTGCITSINEANRQFWDRRDTTPHLDSSGRMDWRTGDAAPTQGTAFRDAMHDASRAATPREQIAALNRAAKSFWTRGEPPTLIADALRTAPTPTTVGEINQRNRAFWAGRS